MIQIICKSESYTYNAYHIFKGFLSVAGSILQDG